MTGCAGKKYFGDDRPVFIVAEIGNNHEGDFDRAERMIGEAAAAGADAVKFQTIRAETLVNARETARRKTLGGFELSFSQFEALARRAGREGVVFLSTPFDLESVRFLDGLVPMFKIASGDLPFTDLLEAVADRDKPVMLSRGAANQAEIRAAVDRIVGRWRERGVEPGLALMHCVALYPTPPEAANLAAIPALAQAFGLPAGYSDHTLGVEAAVLAVAMGARIIEKHFTLAHDLSPFRDHQLSADPAEMRELTRRVRLAEAYRGEGGLSPSPGEAAVREGMRRGACAARDLAAGTRIEAHHIAWLRPLGEFGPEQAESLCGRTLGRGIGRGEPFTDGHFGRPA